MNENSLKKLNGAIFVSAKLNEKLSKKYQGYLLDDISDLNADELLEYSDYVDWCEMTKSVFISTPTLHSYMKEHRK